VPTVAHKTHEFGTFIRFKYRNQVQSAIVTDRGPYVGKREWDLNPCLSKALGFDGVGEVEYNILTQVN
jgi:rare lipoprotein A (peptidoglycan hydrolase)